MPLFMLTMFIEQQRDIEMRRDCFMDVHNTENWDDIYNISAV